MSDALDLGFATEETARERSRTLEEPEWLLDERLDAIRRYAELPAETNQLFTTYLDLRAARFAEIEPYSVVGEAGEIDERVPEGAAALLHVRDDAVVARALSAEAQRAGVVVDTFANLIRTERGLLRPVLEGGRTLPPTDKFAQLARAVSSVGVVVYVPDGVALANPLVVRWSAGEPGTGLIGRTVVVLGRDARANLLEEQVDSRSGAEAGRQSLWAGTMEVVLADGASLDVAGEENFGEHTVAFVNRHSTLQTGASLRWAMATVGGLLVKSRIDNQLVGDGASVHQAEIGFGGGAQLFDLTSYTRHLAEGTTGDLLSKGVFQERSRGYFKGIASIDKTAPGTDSFLGQFAMLLGKRARSVAIPSLEIDQPNVRRASHSSSVGPIDEAQIFYLMSRGLARDVARKFIVLGFLEPVVARIPLAEAQERLRLLLDRKWESAEPAPVPRAA